MSETKYFKIHVVDFKSSFGFFRSQISPKNKKIKKSDNTKLNVRNREYKSERYYGTMWIHFYSNYNDSCSTENTKSFHYCDKNLVDFA